MTDQTEKEVQTRSRMGQNCNEKSFESRLAVLTNEVEHEVRDSKEPDGCGEETSLFPRSEYASTSSARQTNPQSFSCSFCEMHFDKPEPYRKHVYLCSLPNPPVSHYNLPDENVFSSQGDLLLEICDLNGAVAQFLVDSEMLKEASPVFASMLKEDSPFLEGQLVLRNGFPAILRLDDEMQGLHFVLDVLYSRDRSRLKPKDVRQLYEVALVTDKYDFEFIQSLAQEWKEPDKLDDFYSSPKRYRSRDTFSGDDRDISPEWLVIAWIFGFEKEFKDAAAWILENSVYRDGCMKTVRNTLLFFQRPKADGKALDLPYGTPAIVSDRLELLQGQYFDAVECCLNDVRTQIHDIQIGQTAHAPRLEGLLNEKATLCTEVGHDSYCSTVANLPTYFPCGPTCRSKDTIAMILNTVQEQLTLYPGYYFQPSESEDYDCPWIDHFKKQLTAFDQQILQSDPKEQDGALEKVSLWDFKSRQMRFPEIYKESLDRDARSSKKRKVGLGFFSGLEGRNVLGMFD
ncbi:hypothetical protein BJ508DRAFT_350344 [Ascobolus immersus RN42]|uniref:BTB domain-containing protein n=1 Tax=Ascobolus immersus RN42 TaxID=1160509 RepID=A0A3N4INI3_ASCIM|nr:hypothetical protein BJ508DRAFT_350344 [Ascobolus immersus RN42]